MNMADLITNAQIEHKKQKLDVVELVALEDLQTALKSKLGLTSFVGFVFTITIRKNLHGKSASAEARYGSFRFWWSGSVLILSHNDCHHNIRIDSAEDLLKVGNALHEPPLKRPNYKSLPKVGCAVSEIEIP